MREEYDALLYSMSVNLESNIKKILEKITIPVN